MNVNAWSLIALPLMLVIFVAYVAALVNAAEHSKWIWFVLMLLIQPLFLLYYLVAYKRVPPLRLRR